MIPLVVRFLTNEAISIEVIDGHGSPKQGAPIRPTKPATLKTLASQIDRELQIGERKHCVVYERELKRLWPLDEKDREAQIAQFAKKYGFRLRLYRKGLCAIFDKWPRPERNRGQGQEQITPKHNHRGQTRIGKINMKLQNLIHIVIGIVCIGLLPRRLFVLIFSLALVCAAHGGKQQGKTTTHASTSQRVSTKSPQHVPAKSPQHVPTKSSQHVAAHAEHPATSNAHLQHAQPIHHTATVGHSPKGGERTGPTGLGRDTETTASGGTAAKPAASIPSTPVYHYNFRTKSGLVGHDFTRPLTPDEQSAIARQVENGQPKGTRGAHGSYDYENGAYHYNFRTKSGLIGRDFTRPLTPDEQSAIARQVENEQPEGTRVRPGGGSTKAKVSRLGPKQFKLPSKPDPAIVGAKFEGTGHISGSETWTDPKYGAFRDYRQEWHDKNWWEHHCDQTHQNRPYVAIILVYGGWYSWHAGYWYPAWGYDSQNSYYPYDGPIYAYAGLAPDQVVANVQAALQALGYYQGPMDGLLGAATREAIANYQRDHGLYTTSAIDEPTLAELGMS